MFFIFLLFIFLRDCECFYNFKSLLFKVRYECVSILHFIHLFFFQQSKTLSSMEEETIKIMNQDLVRLDHFDGSNLTSWQDKACFLLMTLKIFYILDPTLAPLSEQKKNVISLYVL